MLCMDLHLYVATLKKGLKNDWPVPRATGTKISNIMVASWLQVFRHDIDELVETTYGGSLDVK